MGALANALRTLTSVLPERKVAVGAQIPTWESGDVQYPRYYSQYLRYALDGYAKDEICFACLPAGAPVTFADGHVAPIETICLGDCMRSHRGRAQPVTELFALPYSGEMYSIKRIGRTDPIVSTAGHPFYVARRPSNPSSWFGYEGRANRKTGRRLDRLTYLWVTADQLRKGDFLLEAVPPETFDPPVHAFERQQAPGMRSRLHIRGGEVPVSDDLLELSGYYLAEGYGGGGKGVHFAFHRDETDLHADVCRLMRSLFEARVRHYAGLENGQTRVLSFNSALASGFFGQFGRGARHKSIPGWIMMLPPERQAGLLRCFWRGDGCVTRSGFNCATASRSLAEQIHVLLLRQGIASAVRTTRGLTRPPAAPVAKPRTCYTVQVDGEAGTRLAALLEQAPPVPASRRNAAFIHNGYAHYAVREVTHETVDGVPVYNLEVAEDHSYTAYGVLTHNCIEELSTSAAEPRLRAMRKSPSGKDPEELHDHPVLALFERPNPFLSRFQLIASLIMYRSVAGNGYLQIERSGAGKAVELWLLRPDRMFVVPDERTHIGGWEYRLGDRSFALKASDVIHTRTRNPLDDYYGLPPLAVCAERVDTDTFMRSFTLSFFRNAGVPAGLLSVTKQVLPAERELIRGRLRSETGGPANWHSLLVLDQTEATYTPMGLPLGSSGIVLPELDEISEARIAMTLGVPLELIGARLGMVHGNRSTTLAARGTFWDETLVPLYQELAADLSRGLYQEYAGTPDEWDYLEFDLSTVKALQEDDDAKHKRVREDLFAGLLSVQEARTQIGQEPEYEPDALLMLARGTEPMTPQTAQEGAPLALMPAVAALPAPADASADPNAERQTPNGNGKGNGKGKGNGNGKKPSSKEQLAALAQLAAGKD